MKRIFISAVLSLLSCLAWGQGASGYKAYFEEARKAAAANYGLWDRDLYGPILLIDTATRSVYANVPDEEGNLKESGGIYTGVYPEDRVYANTFISWGGTDWAMVMLPLPDNKYDRAALMIHERFHVMQPGLGFTARSTYNKHLNETQGRIYMILELQALKAAVNAREESEIMRHIGNALIFRTYRHSIYPAAAGSENELELNEGLAEYTGETASGRPDRQKAKHFSDNIEGFYRSPSFVRSFAYQTIPIYGHILDRTDKGWNKGVTEDTDLTALFIGAFGVRVPGDIEDAVSRISGMYGAGDIIARETAREEKAKERERRYYRELVEEPHLTVRLENMEIQFDPRNVIPMDGYGTVYPLLTLADNWGKLKAAEGAMMNEMWTEVVVSAPLAASGRTISGRGWTIELADGYELVKDAGTGDYTIRKHNTEE